MEPVVNHPSERRRAARYRVTFRLVCNDGRAFFPGTVLDLSETGILFRSNAPLEMGSMVDLIPLGEAGDMLFDISAEVVRMFPAEDRPDRWNVGLHFRGLDANMKDALAKIIAAMPDTPDEPQGLGDTLYPVAEPGEAANASRSQIMLRARVAAGVRTLTGT